MNFDPDNVPEFKMPTKMLDKVYELSGSREGTTSLGMAGGFDDIDDDDEAKY